MAVKILHMQSAGDLLHNNQDTNDAINFSLKKSVQYHVWKSIEESALTCWMMWRWTTLLVA